MKYNELLFKIVDLELDQPVMENNADEIAEIALKASSLLVIILLTKKIRKVIKESRDFKKSVIKSAENQKELLDKFDKLEAVCIELEYMNTKFSEGLLKLKKDSKKIIKPEDIKDQLNILYSQLNDINNGIMKLNKIVESFREFGNEAQYAELKIAKKEYVENFKKSKQELDTISKKISNVKNIKLSVHEACYAGEITEEERDLLLSIIEE